MSKELIKSCEVKIVFYNNCDECYSKTLYFDMVKPTKLDLMEVVNNTINDKPQLKGFDFKVYLSEVYRSREIKTINDKYKKL